MLKHLYIGADGSSISETRPDRKPSTLQSACPPRLLGLMPDTQIGGRAVAVCLSGQMRVLVAAQLHLRLRDHVLDALPADAFVSLDLDDTRAWGKQLKPSRADYDEALRVLLPVAHEVISLVPHDGGRMCVAPALGDRVCQAHDCGTFKCGCYINGCTHCEVAAYIPMHDHNSRCLAMIARHEAIRPSGRCGAASPVAQHRLVCESISQHRRSRGYLSAS